MAKSNKPKAKLAMPEPEVMDIDSVLYYDDEGKPWKLSTSTGWQAGGIDDIDRNEKSPPPIGPRNNQ